MFGNLRYLEEDSPDRRLDALYHDAKQKQQRQEEKKQQKILAEMKEQIDFDESFVQSQPTQRRMDDFYEYNRRWQTSVVQRRLAQRALLNEETKPKQHHRQANDPYLPVDYRGPIEGWKSRVEEHQTKRSNAITTDQFTYHPQLNKNSIIICQQNEAFNNQVVEERLLKYGIENKNKKLYQKQQENFEQQLEIERLLFKPNLSSTINGSQIDERPVFQRLYEYADYYDRKKQNQLELIEDSNYNPVTIVLTPEMEQRVNEKRKDHPLYQQNERHPSNNLQEQFDKQDRTLSKQQFDQFLARNFEHKSSKIQLNMHSNKEDEELRECSFNPYINPRSQELLKNIDSDVVERSNKLIQDKKDDVRKLKDELFISEMQECSFKPDTHINVVKEKNDKKMIQKKEEDKKNEKLKQDRAQRKVVQRSVSPFQQNQKNSQVRLKTQKEFSPPKIAPPHNSNQSQGQYNLQNILKQNENYSANHPEQTENNPTSNPKNLPNQKEKYPISKNDPIQKEKQTMETPIQSGKQPVVPLKQSEKPVARPKQIQNQLKDINKPQQKDSANIVENPIQKPLPEKNEPQIMPQDLNQQFHQVEQQIQDLFVQINN